MSNIELALLISAATNVMLAIGMMVIVHRA